MIGERLTISQIPLRVGESCARTRGVSALAPGQAGLSDVELDSLGGLLPHLAS